MTDIQDIIEKTKSDFKPKFRVINKKDGEFALINLISGEKKSIFVLNDDLEKGILIFSSFVDDMKKIAPSDWKQIRWKIEDEDEKQLEQPIVETNMPYMDSEDKTKKIFDKNFQDVGQVKVKISKDVFLMDMLTACFIENVFIKDVKRSSEGGIEEIVFLEDDPEKPLQKNEKKAKSKLRKNALKFAPKKIRNIDMVTELE